jgi:hypothetical protein
MSERQHNTKPKPAGIINTIIYTIVNIAMINLVALLILLGWFSLEGLIKGFGVSIVHENKILITNLTFIEHSRSYLSNVLVNKLNHVHEIATHLSTHCDSALWQNIINVVSSGTEIELTRFICIILLLPLFLLLLLVSIMDGLVKRDVRKYQGARESTYMFHRFKNIFGFGFFISLLFYLCLPLALSPLAILLPQIILLSLVCHISISNFKKYV